MHWISLQCLDHQAFIGSHAQMTKSASQADLDAEPKTPTMRILLAEDNAINMKVGPNVSPSERHTHSLIILVLFVSTDRSPPPLPPLQPAPSVLSHPPLLNRYPGGPRHPRA